MQLNITLDEGFESTTLNDQFKTIVQNAVTSALNRHFHGVKGTTMSDYSVGLGTHLLNNAINSKLNSPEFVRMVNDYVDSSWKEVVNKVLRDKAHRNGNFGKPFNPGFFNQVPNVGIGPNGLPYGISYPLKDNSESKVLPELKQLIINHFFKRNHLIAREFEGILNVDTPIETRKQYLVKHGIKFEGESIDVNELRSLIEKNILLSHLNKLQSIYFDSEYVHFGYDGSVFVYYGNCKNIKIIENTPLGLMPTLGPMPIYAPNSWNKSTEYDFFKFGNKTNKDTFDVKSADHSVIVSIIDSFDPLMIPDEYASKILSGHMQCYKSDWVSTLFDPQTPDALKISYFTRIFDHPPEYELTQAYVYKELLKSLWNKAKVHFKDILKAVIIQREGYPAAVHGKIQIGQALFKIEDTMDVLIAWLAYSKSFLPFIPDVSRPEYLQVIEFYSKQSQPTTQEPAKPEPVVKQAKAQAVKKPTTRKPKP